MKAYRLALLAFLLPWHCPDSIGLTSPDSIVMKSASPVIVAPSVVAMADGRELVSRVGSQAK